MTNYTHSSSHDYLQNVVKKSARKQHSNVQPFSALKHLFSNAVAALCRGDEPRVWQKHRRNGKMQWYGYDPVTGRSFSCTSESEMRCWLEARYYQ